MEMDTGKLKSKFFYFFSLSSMCAITVFIAYAFFLRTVDVDITKNASYIYTGENGNAKVTVENGYNDLNQRVQEFLSSVTYEVSPNKNLSNGDIIHVVASYDENLAEQYHFKAINPEIDVEVQGLSNRFESYDLIDPDYLERIYKAHESYVSSHAQEIFELNEVTEDSYRLSDTELVYRAFLQSKSTQSDRIVSIYKLTYEFEEETIDIYYLVSLPDINDSNKINRQDMFGEKVYLTEQEKTEGLYHNYIERIYSSQFDVYDIEIREVLEEEIVEEEPLEETEEENE